jgi:glycosyltransferase involved in cell wall biosynthesis
LIRPRELRAIREASAVTVVSDYVKRTVEEFSGREQIPVIHNWIDGELFLPGDDSSGRSVRPFRLFMAGSHSRRKGFDLLPAFAHALGPGFEIRYAGGKSKLTSSVQNVVELGRISDAQLIREYQECDAVVSLSRYEGFGYTALEAIACGKAFLGFHTSALPEVVAQGDGVLVPLGDVKALAAAAHELQAQAGRDSTGAKAGRNRILQRFSAANLDRYVDAYARLIEQGPRARGPRDG